MIGATAGEDHWVCLEKPIGRHCDRPLNRHSCKVVGIIGFEPRAARGANYVYNPDRNPNLLDLPAKLPVELICEWDKQADLRNGEIESDYRTAFGNGVSSLH